MISVKLREPHIAIVTRGGDATGADQNIQQARLQVRPAAQKKASLDVQNEKEVLLDVLPEFVVANKLLSNFCFYLIFTIYYDITPHFYLNNFLNSYILIYHGPITPLLF